MQLTVLGSGYAAPTARRASAGYLVEWSGGALLVDASSGTYVRALRTGLEASRIRALLLTHFHPDHTADLPGMVWALRQMPEPPDAPLRIAGPPGTGPFVARVEAAFGDWACEPWVACGYPFDESGLRATAFPARHSPEALCLRIEADGRTLAFSGDTADCDGLREACRDVDLALLECTSPVAKEGHMTSADCEAVVRAAKPRRVLLTHLPPAVESDLPLAEDGLVVPV